MNTTTRLYPGMCDDNLEIFFHKEENKLKIIYKGAVKCFSEIPTDKRNTLRKIIKQNYLLRKTLSKMHPNNPNAQLEQLAKCRFGGLNFQPDITSDTITSDHIQCNKRNTCIGCGIVCQNLKYNDVELTQTDIKAISMMATDYKCLAIADELGMPEGSYHVYRTRLNRKLNIKSRPELARVGVELGLI